MSKSASPFVWYELMTTDTKAAATFYSEVVQWKAEDAGMPDMSYTMFKAGDAMIAGLMTLPKEASDAGARPGWIGYVGVDDVDAVADRAARKGGTVHRQPADIPGVGRFAVLADPHGAVLALFKGEGGDPPPAAPDQAGHVGWHELMAGEWQASFAFYADLFGWAKLDAMDMGEMGTYQMFGPEGGQALGGMMTKPKEVPAPHWRYYFNVDGIDAAKQRLEKAGGRTIMGPHEVPGGGWIVHGIDPQGAEFALHSAKR